MQLSVIIVSWNTKELLRSCLKSLFIDLKNSNVEAEVILVDNNSHDGSVEMVSTEFPAIKLIANSENQGFGRANNQAFQIATGEKILLLNPDTEIQSGASAKLLEFIDSHPHAGIVAPQLINPDGSVQRSCREFPTLANMFYELSGLSRIFSNQSRFRKYKMLDFDHQSTREVDQPEGACLLFRKEVLDQVGWFDEKFFMLFEEVDLCYRTKQAGWQIWFYNDAQVIHHYGQSIKQVKARMILHSHRGMYHYWSKHHSRWYYQIFKPVLWLGLMILAIIRIILYKIKGKL